MSNQSETNGNIEAELQYYKQQIKELSAHTIKQDAKISSLHQQLKKKERGFQLLSKLQTFIGKKIQTKKLFRETLKKLKGGLNMDIGLIARKTKNTQSFEVITALGKEISDKKFQEIFELDTEIDLWEKKYLLINSETQPGVLEEQITEVTGIPYFIAVPFETVNHFYVLICGRKKERPPFSVKLDERDVETLLSIVLFLSEHLEMIHMKEKEIEQKRIQANLKVEAEKERSKAVETELRAEAAELQLRAAEAQARALDAEERRKREELERAREVQKSILPNKIPDFKGYEIAALQITATEVGGDYYDFIPIENTDYFMTVVGDASGHGTSAGLMMAMTKIALNACIFTHPKKVLKWMNNLFKKHNPAGLNMALNCALFKKNTVTISSAAIPPVLKFHADTQVVEEIEFTGLPLGAMKDIEYDEYTIKLQKGDRLLFLSDGYVELMNEQKEIIGYDRLIEIFEKSVKQPVDETLQNMWEYGKQWMTGDHPNDDITLLLVQKSD